MIWWLFVGVGIAMSVLGDPDEEKEKEIYKRLKIYEK